MNEFVKQNWFKLSFSIAIILIGFSVFYYFVVFIPKKDEDRIEQLKQEQIIKDQKDEEVILFNNKIKCNTLYDKLRQQFNNVAGVYYDQILNTCIVKYFKNGEVQETSIEDFQVEK